MVYLVSKAEKLCSLKTRKKSSFVVVKKELEESAVSNIVKGVFNEYASEQVEGQLLVRHFADRQVLDYLSNKSLKRFAQQGNVTPDHVIRIKSKPLILSQEEAACGVNGLRRRLSKALSSYIHSYDSYFKKNNKLSKNKKITSIICSTEFSALSAIKACNYLNLEIGKDISIITFDGPLVKDLSTPPITAISFPVQELGKRAIKILLKGHLNKKNYSNFEAKSDIIERGSVHQIRD